MTQLDRMERKLDQLLAKEVQPFTVEEAMVAVNLKSRSAFYALLKIKGVKAIRRGRFARKDIVPLTEA